MPAGKEEKHRYITRAICSRVGKSFHVFLEEDTHMRMLNCVVGIAVAVALVASPAAANLLDNGDFTAGTAGWSSTQGGFGVGGAIWDPGDPPSNTPRAHVQSGNAVGNWLAYQTVNLDNPGEDLTLTGWYAWGAWAPAEHGVFVFDGGSPSGTILSKASAVVASGPTSAGWAPVDLNFTAPGSQVTVAFGWINGAAWSNGNATFAADLVLVPEPASLLLLGLAGLPLLRRRRA
jgi:hypothetical protein